VFISREAFCALLDHNFLTVTVVVDRNTPHVFWTILGTIAVAISQPCQEADKEQRYQQYEESVFPVNTPKRGTFQQGIVNCFSGVHSLVCQRRIVEQHRLQTKSKMRDRGRSVTISRQSANPTIGGGRCAGFAPQYRRSRGAVQK